MRLRTAAWFALIWFTVPATAIAAQVFVGSTFPTGSGYGLAADIRAYASLVLVAPVACLGAALFGGRLRRSRVLQTERNRRRPAIVYFRIAVLPVLAMSGVVMATMAVTAMSETGGTPIVDPRLGLAAVFQSIAFVLLGMALGLNLPPVVALPCAIVVPYILVAFPPALDIYWLRHVTGISTNCCWVYQDLPARAIAAHILFSISVDGTLLNGAVYALFPNTVCSTADVTSNPTAAPAPPPDDGAIVRAWWSGLLGLDPVQALDSGGGDERQRTELARIEALPLAQQKEAINTLVQRAAQVCGGAKS